MSHYTWFFFFEGIPKTIWYCYTEIVSLPFHHHRSSKRSGSAQSTNNNSFLSGTKSLGRAQGLLYLRQGDARKNASTPAYDEDWDPEQDAKATTLSRDSSGRGSIRLVLSKYLTEFSNWPQQHDIFIRDKSQIFLKCHEIFSCAGDRHWLKLLCSASTRVKRRRMKRKRSESTTNLEAWTTPM